jgi:aryl-alcohol dehydrogenase-like predicted oxidoreductase
LVEELELVAEKAGNSLTHMAIAFTLAHPAVTSAIIGPRTMEQLEDLLAGADVRVSDEILDAIDEVVEPGSVIEVADIGWEAPWMQPEARRLKPTPVRT